MTLRLHTVYRPPIPRSPPRRSARPAGRRARPAGRRVRFWGDSKNLLDPPPRMIVYYSVFAPPTQMSIVRYDK